MMRSILLNFQLLACFVVFLLKSLKGLQPRVPVKKLMQLVRKGTSPFLRERPTFGSVFLQSGRGWTYYGIISGQKCCATAIKKMSQQLVMLSTSLRIFSIYSVCRQQRLKQCLGKKVAPVQAIVKNWAQLCPWQQNQVNLLNVYPKDLTSLLTSLLGQGCLEFQQCMQVALRVWQSTMISSSSEQNRSELAYRGVLKRWLSELFLVQQKQTGIRQQSSRSIKPTYQGSCWLFQMMQIQEMSYWQQSVSVQCLRQLEMMSNCPSRAWVTVSSANLDGQGGTLEGVLRGVVRGQRLKSPPIQTTSSHLIINKSNPSSIRLSQVPCQSFSNCVDQCEPTYFPIAGYFPLMGVLQHIKKEGVGCLRILLIICLAYDDQMSRQQDKSKDQISFSPSVRPLSPLIEVPSFDFRHLPESPGIKFFDKFKQPDYQTRSAFRLIHPHNAKHGCSSKRPEIIRKHRGNYRKYTVAEKEEAVKQILEGVDAKEISQKYGIPRRNLLRWKKNGCERKEGGGRPTDGEMQLTLYTKIDGKILITEKDIRSEAKRLSKLADFKASKGWYCKFSRRYNQWKKQERERILKLEGKDASFEDREVFLLPEVSGDSDDESDSDMSESTPQQSEP